MTKNLTAALAKLVSKRGDFYLFPVVQEIAAEFAVREIDLLHAYDKWCYDERTREWLRSVAAKGE